MTKQFIVTVIVPRPGRRDTEECPLGGYCSAPAGRHHSMLVWAEDGEAAKAMLTKDGYYVARVEIANTGDML